MTPSQMRVEDLEFEVRESAQRATLAITIDRDGGLILACPPNIPEEERKAFIQEKLVWIYTKLQEKAKLATATVTKEYVNGEGFYYLGKDYRLKIVPADSQKFSLRLYRGRFQLGRDAQPEARQHFIDWYQDHIAPILQRKVEQYTERVGTTPQTIHVRDLGYRWGSTDKRGHLYFHWRVALLPVQMLEYIVVHELVHLVESKHTPAFWERVERIIPDYREKKKWLALKGGRYDL